MMDTDTPQAFGDEWTEQKLDALIRYIDEWDRIMSPRSFFKKIYIDPFCGPGTRMDPKTGIIAKGSPIRVLERNLSFNEYHFVDANKTNCETLLQHQRDYLVKGSVSVECGDANTWIQTNLPRIMAPECNKAVMFLDPFAMHLKHSSLQTIAQTEGIDLWLLFPHMAVIRNLPRNKRPLSEWERKLADFFGPEGWEGFYKSGGYQNVFNFDEECTMSQVELLERQGHRAVLDAYGKRLASIFPGHCPKYAELKDTKNHLHFALFFVTSAPAKGLKPAISIASHLINRINSGH